jgi:pyruvate/2-oxoglutarate dehydrogenase complex dihydrolipoamide dehydrogenase (E3) component
VELLSQALSADGVELRLGAEAVLVARNGDEVRLTTRAPDDTTTVLTGDVVLVATGRTPNAEMPELNRAGVDTRKRSIIADRKMGTTCRGIWAAGDVTGGLRVTHMADYQARLVVRNAFFPFDSRATYTAVPWVIYTDPELAHVGLTEAEARARHGKRVRVWRRPLNDHSRTRAWRPCDWTRRGKPDR